MAKVSSIMKNDKRIAMAKKWEPIRKELRKKVVNEKLSDEERYEAHVKLQKLPRDTSRIRTRNRCFVTGRSRGNLKKFGISRLVFRKLAHEGRLPGVTKSSW